MTVNCSNVIEILTCERLNTLNDNLSRFCVNAVAHKTPMYKSLQQRYKTTIYDTFGRVHSYLRLSVMDTCNLRCFYCMPHEETLKQFVSNENQSTTKQLMTTDEITQISKFLITHGVKRIRLTGGEPTIRRDIIKICENLNTLRPLGLLNLSITTNGLILYKLLNKLNYAGLDTINISLDTLDAKRYAKITKINGLTNVMRSIDETKKYNFKAIKINVVVMNTINTDEIIPFVEYFKNENIELRFIEYMPFFGTSENFKRLYFPAKNIRKIIECHFGPLTPIFSTNPSKVAKCYHVPNCNVRIGFISSVSEPFCGDCDRLRILADGSLQTCLFGNKSKSSLLPLLPQGDEVLYKFVMEQLKLKKYQHNGIKNLEKHYSERPMILIGG